MVSRTSFAAISIVALLGCSSALCAQRAKTPTLDEILGRLEANLNHYDAGVPSLFCDEHVVSSQVEYGPPDQTTITDSIFRLKRTTKSNHTTLVESREIRSIDGKPATSQHVEGPTLLSGIFEGGLAVVSFNQKACMNYALQPTDRGRPAQRYVVRFATALTPQNSADCFLQERSNGQVVIDPASMQVRQLKIITPRHVISDGDAFSPGVVGKRELTVDYAPVLFDNGTFWMPSAISMRVTYGFGFHRIVWSYRATYRNYHRMEVTSRILPGSETPVR